MKAMRERARANDLTICYCKKQIGVSFSCVWLVIDNEFRHNICQSSVRIHSTIALLMVIYNYRPHYMHVDAYTEQTSDLANASQ